jgi:hypothetical protein
VGATGPDSRSHCDWPNIAKALIEQPISTDVSASVRRAVQVRSSVDTVTPYQGLALIESFY